VLESFKTTKTGEAAKQWLIDRQMAASGSKRQQIGRVCKNIVGTGTKGCPMFYAQFEVIADKIMLKYKMDMKVRLIGAQSKFIRSAGWFSRATFP